jgi:hypothetical protein
MFGTLKEKEKRFYGNINSDCGEDSTGFQV